MNISIFHVIQINILIIQMNVHKIKQVVQKNYKTKNLIDIAINKVL